MSSQHELQSLKLYELTVLDDKLACAFLLDITGVISRSGGTHPIHINSPFTSSDPDSSCG